MRLSAEVKNDDRLYERGMALLGEFLAGWPNHSPAGDFDFRLIVAEALANVWKHSGAEVLLLRFERMGDEALAVLEYETRPFKAEPIPEALRGEHGGYGLHLMHTLSDRLEFRFLPAGVRVVMAKRL